MTKTTLALLLALFILSCSPDHPGTSSNNLSTDIKPKTNEKHTAHNTFYISDTSDTTNPFVRLSAIDTVGNFEIEWGTFSSKSPPETDFSGLQNGLSNKFQVNLHRNNAVTAPFLPYSSA